MSGTERWYRRLMLAYPGPYRRRFGDEMLAVLMEAGEDAAGHRARMGESWSLLRHGLAMRLGLRERPGVWSRPSAAGAAVLATMVAVLGVQNLIQSGVGSLASTDAGSSATSVLAVAVLSLLCFGLLVLRRPILAAFSAWAVASVGIWQSRTLFGDLSRWGGPGPDAGLAGMEEAANAVVQAQQLALLVPAIVLAVLLSRPGVGARAVEVVGHSTVARALIGGLLLAAWADQVGMSQIWAPILSAALMVAALVRASVLMRSGLLVAFAFGYLLLAGLADGSGSRLPDPGPLLLICLGTLPVAVFVAGVLAINRVDANASLRIEFAHRLETFARTVADRGPNP
jgi:hypothetical protein